MTRKKKKGHKKFWRMKIEKFNIFGGKGEIVKVFHGGSNFFRKLGGI